MKGLTFERFIAHDTNATAYDMCTKVAALENGLPRPIVLLGEGGAGKSHLLWSMVNYFRQNNLNVGVALISAKDFPKKVKQLADKPEKLDQGHPIFLLVDDLHLFDHDMDDLEKVCFAFHEHGHHTVFATNIHPNVLPSLSGKFKALLNGGAIIGMKPLPKSTDSAIPEAVLQQITTLKARIAELEKGEVGAAVANGPETTSDEAARDGELEQVVRERDSARSALKRSEAEAEALRDEVGHLKAQGASSPTDTASLANSVDVIMERLTQQRDRYTERIRALEAQCEELIALAEDFGTPTDDADEEALPESGSPDGAQDTTEDSLAKAREQLTAQTAEIEELRDTSDKLAEALHRQETEVRFVIEGIRETLAALTLPAGEQEQSVTTEAPQGAHTALKTIAEQLDALENDLPRPDTSASHEPLVDEDAPQPTEDVDAPEAAAQTDAPPPPQDTIEESAEPSAHDAEDTAAPEAEDIDLPDPLTLPPLTPEEAEETPEDASDMDMVESSDTLPPLPDDIDPVVDPITQDASGAAGDADEGDHKEKDTL